MTMEQRNGVSSEKDFSPQKESIASLLPKPKHVLENSSVVKIKETAAASNEELNAERKKKPSIQVFQKVQRKKLRILHSSAPIDLQRSIDPRGASDDIVAEQRQEPEKLEETEESNQLKDSTSPSKRPLDAAAEIKEFRLNEFYDQNVEMKVDGRLQENKQLHTVHNHKNQLSSLIRNAQQDSELLSERFQQRKKHKKELKEKYGW